MQKRKLALISPGKEGSVVSGQWKGIVNFYRLTLPLLSSMVPKGRFEVFVYDESVDNVPLDMRFDMVAMSVMTPYANRAYELSKIFKNNGSTVVLGGHHPSLMTDEAIDHCDVVVKGDAEANWPLVLEDFLAERITEKRIYDNPIINLNAKKRLVPDRSVLRDKSLLVFNTVETSRGCPHSCDYCTVAAFYKSSYSQYSVESVINEIRSIKGKFIFFVDDNLLASGPKHRARTINLLKALIPLRKKWFCQATINIADDPELLRLAQKAGCMAVYLGLESVTKQSLLEVKKAWNRPDSYYERIKKIRDAGIAIEAGIIFGFDNDKEEDHKTVFDRTAEFVLKTNIESPNAHILTPYPGTPLYNRMFAEGRIIVDNWDYYNTGNVVFLPRCMSADELLEGYQSWYRDVFSVNNIVSRLKKANFPYYALLTNMAKSFEVRRTGFKDKKVPKKVPSNITEPLEKLYYPASS